MLSTNLVATRLLRLISLLRHNRTAFPKKKAHALADRLELALQEASLSGVFYACIDGRLQPCRFAPLPPNLLARRVRGLLLINETHKYRFLRAGRPS